MSHIELPVDASDLIWLLTKVRNTLHMAGYCDEVEEINNMIDAYYTTQELRRPEVTLDDAETIPF
jgi:hypothetical protein